MLKSRIDKDVASNKTKTLWFNAWRYEGREEAQSALIHAVLAKLAEDKTLFEDAKETFKRLKDGASVLKLAKFIGKTAITLTPDLDGFIDCFREESERIAQTMEAFDKDFEDLLKRAKIARIVVFIDDLDRCSSSKVIETFETIKLFLNTPQCTFVIGADALKIEQAVGEVYRVDDARRQKDYLEKIVQIPFTIPAQDLRDITCYVGMLIISRYIDEKGWDALITARGGFYGGDISIGETLCRWPNDNRILFGDSVNAVTEELKDVLPYSDSLARGLRGNPRQIKRFLNILGLRRRLADANNLDVRPDLLIKMGVLEYVWADFFNLIIDTVDPKTGQSDLIDEMVKVATDDNNAASESKVVADSLGIPGLLDYLTHEPRVTGETDLRPYLFLAQTSLGRGRVMGLVPADEKAKALANSIESDDPLMSKTAAKQAAAQEPAIVSSVVRVLVGDLSAAKSILQKTHILTGLDVICRSHKDQYAPVLKALAPFDPTGNAAVAIAASAFLSNAEQEKIDVPPDLKDRFSKASPLAAAFTTGKSRTRRPPGGGP